MSSITETPDDNVFTRIHSRVENALLYVGGITDLAMQTMQQIMRGPLERTLLIAQFEQVGVRSLSIVIIT